MTTLSHPFIRPVVREVIAAQPVVDMHTHLYPPTFGTPVANRSGSTDPAGLMLWGIDELVTYHYLIAEVFRIVPAAKLPYEHFWRMSTAERADHIWQHLFVERTPLSEACRGVITTLHKLGLDPGVKHLDGLRSWFRQQDPDEYVDRVMSIAKVERITMTNAVFDDNERQRWLNGITPDERFAGVLRFDPLLTDWPHAAQRLSSWGYAVHDDLHGETISQVTWFLHEWCDRVRAVYCAVSLPPEYRYPSGTRADDILARCILPVCAERNIPFAMMIGSRRGVNPLLRDAADMGGHADVASVARLCRDFPHNRFLVTMLSRENQHELAVLARKFDNLLPFGCWWFLNNPSLIDEITRMRVELLGTSFVPQHSDARILDQLIYKWEHSRECIGNVLAQKYESLVDAGWPLTRAEIERDARQFFKQNYLGFCQG